MVYPQDRTDGATRAGSGNQSRRLQLRSAPAICHRACVLARSNVALGTRYCSLHTLSSDVVVSAPSFAGCRLFLPCRNLLARSSVQNATFDGNILAQKSAHTQTRMAHDPSDHEVVRAKQWTQKHAQHSAENAQHQQQTMVIKEREDTTDYMPMMRQQRSSSLMRLIGTCCPSN